MVVAPQGLGDREDTTHWNAGFDISTVDDVGFLTALAREISGSFAIDPDKVFTTGVSNGGWMSYHLVALHPEVFKGAGSVIGRMGGATWDLRDTITAAPIIQVSGEDDPWQRDYSSNRDRGWGGAPDVDAQMAFWADRNGATSTETEQVTERTTLTRYSGGTAPVHYYVIEGAGHEVTDGEDGTLRSWDVIFRFFADR